MTPFSLTARISLLFAIAASAVLLMTGYFLARAVDAHFVVGDRQELAGKLKLVRHLLERVDGPEAMQRMIRELDDALVGHHALTVVVADARGRVWLSTSVTALPADVWQARACAPGPCPAAALQQWRHDGHDYRGMVMAMRDGRGQAHRVGVALDIGHHTEFMARFRILLAIAMALAALATATMGWMATHRGLAPLRRIGDLAAGISAERLATRLPETDLPPELQNLAKSFNAMLARLDDSFRRLAEFSADIAHELRTPISNLMTQTQVALSRSRSAEEYREVLQSAAEEYDRLGRMVSDMLFLAKADNRLIVPRLETVDLAREARELIEFHGIVAEERGIELLCAGEATANGDRLMLRQALSNLLANAIRHCPAGGTVSIQLRTNAGDTLVAVENPGTIAAEHLPRLFDRFYTGDPARRAGGEGTGLGLAIVRSIIHVHGGRIAAASDAGLTRFVVHLPAQAVAQRHGGGTS